MEANGKVMGANELFGSPQAFREALQIPDQHQFNQQAFFPSNQPDAGANCLQR